MGRAGNYLPKGLGSHPIESQGRKMDLSASAVVDVVVFVALLIEH